MPGRLPVTRDLTTAFTQYRSPRRGSRGRNSGEVVINAVVSAMRGRKNSAEEPLTGKSARAVEMVDLSRAREVREESQPGWMRSAEEARKVLLAVREKQAQLARAHQKRLVNVFDDEDALEREVQDLSSQLGTLMRECEQSVRAVIADRSGASQKELEFRQNVQRSLAVQLQQLSQQSRQRQRKHLEEVRKRQRGALWDDGIDDKKKYGVMDFIDDGFDDLQVFEVDAMENEAEYRSEEIMKIAQSINELHAVYKEMTVLVIDQGTILDRIDYNTEQVAEHTKEANVQLHRAEHHQKSPRATRCMLFLAVANVLLIFILILKVSARSES